MLGLVRQQCITVNALPVTKVPQEGKVAAVWSSKGRHVAISTLSSQSFLKSNTFRNDRFFSKIILTKIPALVVSNKGWDFPRQALT